MQYILKSMASLGLNLKDGKIGITSTACSTAISNSEKLLSSFSEDFFYKEDAFEYNFKTIWYNKEKVDQLGLSQSECFACISHELGHFLDQCDRWATPQQTREINADQLAVELGLGKSLQTALGKLIDDNPDNQELVKGMTKRISLLDK